MAVQFVRPYRFSGPQQVQMAVTGIVAPAGASFVEGVPYAAGSPLRFSSDDFFRLGEIGIFNEGDRVELVDGEIIQMAPVGSGHSACVHRLVRHLTSRVGQAVVRGQDVLVLPNGYNPYPDVLVARPHDDDYESGHPTHEDALVVVEVAASSLRYDRRVKLEWYAQAAIPEYWLVDLRKKLVTIHQHPVAGEYHQQQVYGRGDSWISAALGGLQMPVDVLFRRR